MAASNSGSHSKPAGRTFTLISRKAPYGRDNAQICLELALATAVFEQKVNYLFMDDGVYQLLGSQQPGTIDAKNILAALQALPLYGVEKIYVDQASLSIRHLTADDLAVDVPVELVDANQATRLIREADTVFTL